MRLLSYRREVKMKVLSLYANIGVAEAYLRRIGIDVVVANELVPRRAELYSNIYPETTMICGDITQDSTYQNIINQALNQGVDVIMATPPCQGISRAGKQREDDMRNLLILPVIQCVLDIRPRYVMIENVPQFTETFISIDDGNIKIIDLIESKLNDYYNISINLIDTKHYGVPQTRQRAIILLSRKDCPIWSIPNKENELVSLRDAIGDLPSLDPFINDVSQDEMSNIFPQYYAKAEEGKRVSVWHKPPKHIYRQVVTMMHTPTGKTAFDNDKYVPLKADGTPVTGYKSTYRRLRWDDPASTVTMDNRKISSQNNVHPGRYLGVDENGDCIYSDARALSLFELMRIMSLPDDWALPLNTNEAFVRSVIGEGIPPLFIKKLFEELKEVNYEEN